MRSLILSPYHGGSHRAWAEGYQSHSAHAVEIASLPASFWKWRMHGAAVTLARRFARGEFARPDVLLATDMLDLTTFMALTRRETGGLPTLLYVHENQLTYPLPDDPTKGPMRRQLGERDRHYAFINYTSMLAAERVCFNSGYHLESFFEELPRLLKHYPDHNELDTIEELRAKSSILPVGIDLRRLDVEHRLAQQEPPLILWNQRWEHDKAPEYFLDALYTMAEEGRPFRVALCGERFGLPDPVLQEAAGRLGERIVHNGYAGDTRYRDLLWEADITISIARHEFFGISLIEAMYCETFPLLPARLSYPEILPRVFHEACLYRGREQLHDKLRWALSHPEERRERSAALAREMARYDWSTLAPTYDSLLQDLKNSTRFDTD